MNELDYKALFESAEVGLICLDREGLVLATNKKAAECLGKTPGIQMPSGLTDAADRIKRAFLQDEKQSYEDLLLIEGQEKWLASTYRLIKNQGDDKTCVLVSILDVTHGHTTEAALTESENLLRHTQKVGRLGSWHVDFDKNTINWSDGLFELYGLDKNDGVPDISTWQHEITPAVNTRNDPNLSIEERISQTLMGEEPYTDDFKITRKDNGEVRYIHSIGQIIADEDGRPARMIGTVQDVTDQKKKEEDIIYISYHDSLTGLFNRRFFEEELARMNTRRQLPLSIILGDVNGLKLVNDVYGHHDGDKLLQNVAELLKTACRAEDLISRWGGDEFIICLPKTDADAAQLIINRIIELRDTDQEGLGIHQLLPSISLGLATKRDESEDIQIIIREAENAMYRQKLLESKAMHSTVLHTMQQKLFDCGIESRQHAERLAVLCQKIGQQMQLPQSQLDDLILLSNLHDIGKIIINEDILNKPGKLTDEEWQEIKRHTETGYRLAKATPELNRIAESILSHHEQWDGKGYPQGLSGQDIPLAARILFAADAYDTMTHDRPYMDAISRTSAREELQQQAGQQFDPAIVETLLAILEEEGR